MLHFPAEIRNLDPAVEGSLDKERPKAGKHPGRLNVPTVGVPIRLRRALLTAISNGGYDTGSIVAHGKELGESVLK